MDGDGVDLAHKLCQGRSGPWTVNGNLGTRSAVALDVDADGDIDIVTNEFNAEPQVLISDLAQRQAIHWLQVRLRGVTSNRDGLGAVVRVVAGGRTQTQQADGKAGYLAQSSLALYFGLGEATAIERVEVVWPGGATQVVEEGLEPNQTIEVTAPEG